MILGTREPIKSRAYCVTNQTKQMPLILVYIFWYRFTKHI